MLSMHRCGPAGTPVCRRSRGPPDIPSTGENSALTRTQIGNHTFRATGITEYLRNGGKLEIAQRMANHESARTTGLYDRRDDQVSLDEVERILI
jgi:integrase